MASSANTARDSSTEGTGGWGRIPRFILLAMIEWQLSRHGSSRSRSYELDAIVIDCRQRDMILSHTCGWNRALEPARQQLFLWLCVPLEVVRLSCAGSAPSSSGSRLGNRELLWKTPRSSRSVLRDGIVCSKQPSQGSARSVGTRLLWGPRESIAISLDDRHACGRLARLRSPEGRTADGYQRGPERYGAAVLIRPTRIPSKPGRLGEGSLTGNLPCWLPAAGAAARSAG